MAEIKLTKLRVEHLPVVFFLSPQNNSLNVTPISPEKRGAQRS